MTIIGNKIVLYTFISLCLYGCVKNENIQIDKRNTDDFSFIFMTDIHLQPDDHRYPDIPDATGLSPLKAFSMVIDTVNQMDVDFILTGGDNIYDVLRGQDRADSLFQMYKRSIEDFNVPVYNVIGNHELFGIYEEGDIDPTNPDYKYGMYERYLGDTYYSFDHKGWHFIALNSIDEKDQGYIGIIDEKQKLWLQEDLKKVHPDTPIAIAMHIPLISAQDQVYPRSEVIEVPNGIWVYNRNEILGMFENHNLKLVLQGHLHWVEDIYIHDTDTRFITGGAIAGRPSWRGFRHGPPGFLQIKIKDRDISWDFIDYGWKVLIDSFGITEQPKILE